MRIDQGDRVCILFINLKKAFNTVDHKILIEKLSYYGIYGISNKRCQSYLANCQQFVTLNNFESFRLKVLCGVPQKCTLGPLLKFT